MKLIMNRKDLSRHSVISSAVEGLLTVNQAAERLRLSPRRIKQLKKEYRINGAVAVIHGNANRPSPKKISKEVIEKILEYRQNSVFETCNFTHFHEVLKSRQSINLSYSSLYRILSDAEIKSPKKRRHNRIQHNMRERKPAAGMLLQADATPYEWFGGKTKYALHGFIDDATGQITGLYLCKNECLLGYLEVMRQTLTDFGIPEALYPDRYSVFFVNPKKALDLSIEEQLEGAEKRVTQFGKIIEQLGIDMFPAESPEAKGRVERLWDTLQSRLPVEFALRDITNMVQANLFLKKYISTFNKQFGVAPKEQISAFVPVPHTVDLDRLLCAQLTRSLSKGSTISILNALYQIEHDKFPPKTKVHLLISEKHGLRALINGAFYPIYPIDRITFKKNKGEMISQTVIDLIERLLLENAKSTRVRV